MIEFIDGEIKDMLGKIFALDEVEKKFEDMLAAIDRKEKADPTWSIQHPLQLTVPFPTPE